MPLVDALNEITRLTESAAGARILPASGDDIQRLGSLRVPVQRAMVKNGYDFVSDDRAASLAAWDYIWHNTSCMEVMNQALYFYQYKQLNKAEYRVIRDWADRSVCWEHSDDLSKIYAEVVEANPGWIIPTLKRWNRSANFWKRRKSMTSLIEYAIKRKRFLPYADLIGFIEPLLDDPEYYVQKGLGWTVREIGNAYPAEFDRFMTKHAARLSPQAWTGATKNMTKEDKARFKAIRVKR